MSTGPLTTLSRRIRDRVGGQVDDGHALEELTVAPKSRLWEWLGVAAIVIGALLMIRSFIENQRFGWDVVGEYIFNAGILAGLRTTLLLTVAAMVLALAVGLLLAVMRLSSNIAMQTASSIYIWIFRGSPVLVQLLFWYNLAALYPTIKIGIPFGGPTFFEGSANSVMTPWVAALFGLGLNEAAYLAEIIRSGIISVEPGQVEAARSLGMKRRLRFRRIVLPQALRVMIPPMTNETIGMLKYTAVVSVLAVPELLYSGQLIYARNYQTIPLLMVVSIWYIATVTVLTLVQMMVERKLAAGWSANAAPRRGRWWWLGLNRRSA